MGGNDSFSVKSLLVKLNNDHNQGDFIPKTLTKFIQEAKVPPRVQFVMWCLALKKLKTSDMFWKRSIVTDNQALCPFCQSVEESVSHLFFECTLTLSLWMEALEWWNIQGFLHSNPIINMSHWMNMCGDKKNEGTMVCIV